MGLASERAISTGQTTAHRQGRHRDNIQSLLCNGTPTSFRVLFRAHVRPKSELFSEESQTKGKSKSEAFSGCLYTFASQNGSRYTQNIDRSPTKRGPHLILGCPVRLDPVTTNALWATEPMIISTVLRIIQANIACSLSDSPARSESPCCGSNDTSNPVQVQKSNHPGVLGGGGGGYGYPWTQG